MGLRSLFKPLPAGLTPQPDALSLKEYRARLKEPRSVVPYLPFQTFSQSNQLFLFEDGCNCGLLLELTPVPCEARNAERMAEIHEQIHQALIHGVDESDPPWVLQLITQAEPSLDQLSRHIAGYPNTSRFGRAWKQVLFRHCRQVTQPNGIFYDDKSERIWRGQQQRTFLAAWQTVPKRPLVESIDATEAAATRIQAALSAAGIQVRRCDSRDVISLVLPWVSARPNGVSPYDYLETLPLPEEGEDLAGHDLAEICLPMSPRSMSDGSWQVGQEHQICLPVRVLTRMPGPGHLTAERDFGDRKGSLFERLPTGTRWVTTIVYASQASIQRHLGHIVETAIGAGYEAEIAAEEAQTALKHLAGKEKLYRVSQAVYLRADAPSELRRACRQAASVLRPEGLQLVDPADDQLLMDAWLRHLPFAFDAKLDRSITRRARLTYGSHLAALAPLYGRSTGTGHPAITFFNAGGEPFCWDPIRDRTRNAHLTLLGPSGSGKSAILNYMLASMMWAHKPRLFIIDMKWPYPSFGLLVDYFQSQGLSVNRIRLMPNDAQALPPFRDAMRLLDDRGQPIADATETDTDDGSEQRDLLGEMVLLAETMVTGGDASARRKFTRPDRLLLSQAILHAAKSVFGRQEYPLTEHVVEALRDLANQGAEGIDPPRARWMAANLQYYTVGLAGQLFNRYGDPFPEADVTLIEPAVIGQEGHQDELTVAFMAILQNIQAVITRDASDNRQTIVLADEKHVVAANPYLGPYTVKIVKVWRSAGTWYWQATQDLEDYTESMRPLINNSDWFIGMSMEKEQLQQLRAFKSLTDEQIGLIEQCRIDPGNYAEGTLIHRNFSSIFRAVLPPLSLALAQSEREERAHRYDLMKRYGYKTQLEAALHVAREIERARSQNVQEDTTEAPR